MRRALALLLLATACGGEQEPPPGTPAAGGTSTVLVSACRLPSPTLGPGRNRFVVTNDAAAPATVAVLVDRQVVEEVRDLAPGRTGEIDVDLSDGPYELSCAAGGAPVRTEFHVEGGGHGHEPEPSESH